MPARTDPCAIERSGSIGKFQRTVKWKIAHNAIAERAMKSITRACCVNAGDLKRGGVKPLLTVQPKSPVTPQRHGRHFEAILALQPLESKEGIRFAGPLRWPPRSCH